MKADEMFEKLGYVVEEAQSNIFIGEGIENFNSLFVIHKKSQTITFYKILISKLELKAINKKCKELGWLDE